MAGIDVVEAKVVWKLFARALPPPIAEIALHPHVAKAAHRTSLTQSGWKLNDIGPNLMGAQCRRVRLGDQAGHKHATLYTIARGSNVYTRVPT